MGEEEIDEIEREHATFRIVGDTENKIKLFEDVLFERQSLLQLANGDVADGFYVDEEFEIVFLSEYKVYISSMDVREIGNDESEQNEVKDSAAYATDFHGFQSPMAEPESLDVHQSVTAKTLANTVHNGVSTLAFVEEEKLETAEVLPIMT